MAELKLYVWKGFYPNYAGGLAFAIAESEEEAKTMVIENMDIEQEESPEWIESGFPERDWGTLEVKSLTEKVTYGVFGGE